MSCWSDWASNERAGTCGWAGSRRRTLKVGKPVNLPNALTLSRLAAIPVLMVLLIARFQGHDQIAAAVFVVVSFTDTLDGQIARRRGMVSDLGKFLDPLADKLFVLSALIVLVQEGLVAAGIGVVSFPRRLRSHTPRSLGARKGRARRGARRGWRARSA